MIKETGKQRTATDVFQSLTPKEFEVMHHLLNGLSTSAISHTMNLAYLPSPRTKAGFLRKQAIPMCWNFLNWLSWLKASGIYRNISAAYCSLWQGNP